MELTHEQKCRYNRHIILDGFGSECQEKLLQSKVLIVGVGGLGSPVALYLAAAGVGTIGIIDADKVSLTNLQRQVIHSTPGVGRMKVDSAEEYIHGLNPDVKVVKYPLFLTLENASEIISCYDFIVDGSDNFSTKYLINDTCVELGKSFCIGGICRYQGQLMTHVPGTGTYRSFFPEPPVGEETDTCSTVGVLGCIAGMIGIAQATECIKYLTGVGCLLTDKLATYDALTMEWQYIHLYNE